MAETAVILCELADEYLDSTKQIDKHLLFAYGKKQWVLKNCLAENAKAFIQIIYKFAKVRLKKLCFKINETTLVLQQKENACYLAANAMDMQLAADILPIIFIDYAPTLEFEVAREHLLRQRELKSYVTTHLYNALYGKHQVQQTEVARPLPMPNCFRSKLRKYQERTVYWMLSRERLKNQYHIKYTTLKAVDGQHQVFKHKYCLQFYAFESGKPMFTLPPGGILADEMGLGKTVELLATLLLNPRNEILDNYWLNYVNNVENAVPVKLQRMPHKVYCICTKHHANTVQCTRCRLWQHRVCVKDDYDSYMCPMCWTELTASCPELVQSRTTIIVSPSVIKTQWYNEISKHISSSLRVLLYPGLRSGVWYSPLELAQYDIVLTDYTILTHEIHYTPMKATDRGMRFEQRYMHPSSPLLMVKWWRVCLDEAQMVESGTSQVAAMVHELPAFNRWAISGTPIQRTIDDLSPLLDFIGMACQPPDAWHTIVNSFLLNHMVDPLLELLQHCMWRTCKSKVEVELGIPPQTEQVHHLELSNVESFYYTEEHNKCTELFLLAAEKEFPADNISSSLASISPKQLKKILLPFLLIRKTCSVPVVQNKNVSTKTYLNPKELLDHLKSNNEQDCKRELRTWASSYNGLAAIHFIRENYAEAISNYKHLLRLAKDYHKESISVDSLLQIHALHNMIKASQLAPREDQLPKEEFERHNRTLNTLELKYLADRCDTLNSQQKGYEFTVQELHNLEQEYKSNTVELFATLVKTSSTFHNLMWNKISDEFSKKNLSPEKLQDVSSMSGVLYVVDAWHERLQKLHRNLCREFEFLKTFIGKACGAVNKGVDIPRETMNFIRTVSACHLASILDEPQTTQRHRPNSQRTCRMCKIDELVKQFECLLYAKELSKEGAAPDGLENPSVEIILIKVVFAFLRTRHEFSEWKLECKNKLDWLDCMQKLVKRQLKYWIEVDYLIKAFDELDMCKLRIMLTDNPAEQSHIRIMIFQLDELTAHNLNMVHDSQINFTRLSGRLKYLQHLQENRDEKPCPICQTLDDDRFVMMICGHYICQNCLDSMKKRFGLRESTTKCPICRQYSEQLYYYHVREDIANVVGHFSTKITNIIAQLLQIKEDSSGQDKVLIFSQWASILKNIAFALTQNDIKYRDKFTNKCIEEFKDPTLNVTCLLLPLSKGSKGLNLIEATHVFLVEPILTPGDELQALGRVHRFGQKKPTIVHRFITKDTIEENIMTLIKSADDTATLSTHWDIDNMTLEGLTQLFYLKPKA